MRRPNWVQVALVAVLFLAGAGMTFGAISSWQDQHSGVPGKAKVGSCTGHQGRYSGGVHCSGTWITGGSLLAGGQVAFGRIEGASKGDVGKTIDVRIHGTDHATVPSITTPIVLGILGIASLVVSVLVGVAFVRPR